MILLFIFRISLDYEVKQASVRTKLNLNNFDDVHNTTNTITNIRTSNVFIEYTHAIGFKKYFLWMRLLTIQWIPTIQGVPTIQLYISEIKTIMKYKG